MRALLLLLLALPGCAMPGFMGKALGLGGEPLPLAEPDMSLPAPDDGTPALRLRWAKGQAVALLIEQHGETRMWRSAGGLVVATDGARVTATAGLREWVAGSRIDGPDPLDEPRSLLGRTATLRRQMDLMRADRAPQGMRFGLFLTCRVSAAPQGQALLVSEQCRGGGTAFTNRYWADPATGGIWRSEQWVGEAGLLRLEVVTPPSS